MADVANAVNISSDVQSPDLPWLIDYWWVALPIALSIWLGVPVLLSFLDREYETSSAPIDDYRRTVTQALGAVFLVTGLLLTFLQLKASIDATNMTLRISSEALAQARVQTEAARAQAATAARMLLLSQSRLVSENFNRALNLLDPERPLAAVGGIDQLRILAGSSTDRFRSPATRALVYYVLTTCPNRARIGREYSVATGNDAQLTQNLRARCERARMSVEEALRAIGGLNPSGQTGGARSIFLTDTDLSSLHLDDAHLSHVDFQGSNLSGIRLNGATLIGANFDKAEVGGSYFENADLTGATFTVASLAPGKAVNSGLSLWGAKLKLKDTAITKQTIDEIVKHQCADFRKNPATKPVFNERLGQLARALKEAKVQDGKKPFGLADAFRKEPVKGPFDGVCPP